METPIYEIPPLPPHSCCTSYAMVVSCDGKTTELYCPLCNATFVQPCPDAYLFDPEGRA